MYPSLYDAPQMPMLDQTNNGGESASSSRRGSLASLSIPGTPPNTYSAFPQHQHDSSPSSSVVSVSPGPSTPQHPVQRGSIYEYTPPHQMQAPESMPTMGVSSKSLDMFGLYNGGAMEYAESLNVDFSTFGMGMDFGMMDMPWMNGNPQFQPVVVGPEHEATNGENETYGLPSWALPTLWPNLSSSSSARDISNATIPFEIDIPSKLTADEVMDMDGLDAASLTDPTFGLGFRFEDLLAPSHL
jgi:hypothetical protein